MYVNVDFVILMQKGSKDEYVKQADEWFAQKKRESATGVYNPQWLEAFKNAYDGWKKGGYRGLPQDARRYQAGNMLVDQLYGYYPGFFLREMEGR